MKKTLFCLMLTAFLAGIAFGSPYMAVSTYEQWEQLLLPTPPGNHIVPMNSVQWGDYMSQWSSFLMEGEPYPTYTTFLPAELYASPYGQGGDPAINPQDAGLVMAWGDGGSGQEFPPGQYASAWRLIYGVDPDLSNKIIKVTITPPQWGANGQINQVSFGMRDVNGFIRSWFWNCGMLPGQLPWNVQTTVIIDTTIMGIGATTPPASGFMSAPGFDITKVVDFIVDENAQWIFGPLPVPPTGTQVFAAMWNYWHNLIVLPKDPMANKGYYVKYSQPIEEIEPGIILGWDEMSVWPLDGTIASPIMADDFPCKDDRPITGFHWWGSFLGWNGATLPPVIPRAFHLAIWTDVPAGADKPYSHPGVMLWEHVCDTWTWNFAGFDMHPLAGDPQYEMYENEACFQFNQLLSEPDWFRQEPGENIYWLSIAAIYDPGIAPQYPWGWKTRPHVFMDDAVRIRDTAPWPPHIGSMWTGGEPVELMEQSWDLAFEITTNQPTYCDNPIPGDLDCNKVVNLLDFAIFASHWLETAP